MHFLPIMHLTNNFVSTMRVEDDGQVIKESSHTFLQTRNRYMYNEKWSILQKLDYR